LFPTRTLQIGEHLGVVVHFSDDSSIAHLPQESTHGLGVATAPAGATLAIKARSSTNPKQRDNRTTNPLLIFNLIFITTSHLYILKHLMALKGEIARETTPAM
jgi:hypothetical protein